MFVLILFTATVANMFIFTPLGRLLSFYCEKCLQPFEGCQQRMMLSFETSPLLHTDSTTMSGAFSVPHATIDTNIGKKGHTPKSSRISRYVEFYSLLERQSSLYSDEAVKTTYITADNIYNQVVRAMSGFKRLCFIWRCMKKKFQTYEVDTDMMMNPLSELKPEHRITLLENDTFYTFKIHDLLAIMKSSLLHSAHGFPGVTKIKNPYTNLVFTKANMYNIYFHARWNTTLVIHPIIHRFFETELNVPMFKLHNEELLMTNAQMCLIDLMEPDAKYDLLKDIYLRYPRSVKSRWLPRRISNVDRDWLLSKATDIFRIYMLMVSTQKDDLYSFYEKLLQRTLYVLVRKYPMMINMHFQHRLMRRTKAAVIMLTDSI